MYNTIDNKSNYSVVSLVESPSGKCKSSELMMSCTLSGYCPWKIYRQCVFEKYGEGKFGEEKLPVFFDMLLNAYTQSTTKKISSNL